MLLNVSACDVLLILFALVLVFAIPFVDDRTYQPLRLEFPGSLAPFRSSFGQTRVMRPALFIIILLESIQRWSKVSVCTQQAQYPDAACCSRFREKVKTVTTRPKQA